MVKKQRDKFDTISIIVLAIFFIILINPISVQISNAKSNLTEDTPVAIAVIFDVILLVIIFVGIKDLTQKSGIKGR